MHCSVCQTSTATTRVGTSDYCSVCGNRYESKKAVASPAKRHMDIRTSRRQPAKAAAELHQGRARSQVLDLRQAKPAVPAAPAVPAKVEQPAHHSAQFANRIKTAKQISRSPLINRFDVVTRPAKPAAPISQPRPTAQPPRQSEPSRQTLPNQVVTQHQAMAKLAPAASTAQSPAPVSNRPGRPSWKPRGGLSPHRGRILTTAATLAIMSGYIWLQNSPKLALQNASNQAGVAATLPGYLPSSYNLSSTKTAPGLVTLDFTSPSITEILKIAQHRTAWDSSSLLDNFVAKQADDYSTVHGQGLTIYLFGENQAAWVNHGIWYSIEGAGKLSREQILKIAYSL